MGYINYSTRSIVENDGNTTLYRNTDQRLYVISNGEKVFFKADFGFNNYKWFDDNFMHERTWDWYAVEKYDDHYKVIARSRTDQSNDYLVLNDQIFDDVGTMSFAGEGRNRHYWSVLKVDLNGIYLGEEIPQRTTNSGYLLRYHANFRPHRDYLSPIVQRFYSPLERWVLNNPSLLNDYENEGTIDINSDTFYRNGRLEDWAYKKYVELYPAEKVPATYGIEGNYPSSENAFFGKKTLTGNFRDYKFYNRGSGEYEIKTDSGFDEITGMTLEFNDKTIDAVDDIKGVFDQVTGLNTDSGKMFRLYNAAFARFPDASGLQYWIGNFSSGKDDDRAVASSFIASTEFNQRYGENVSNPKYVETLYTNVLGRDYDQSGYTYWLGNLNNGLETRYELLLGFAESAENKALFTEMTGFG